MSINAIVNVISIPDNFTQNSTTTIITYYPITPLMPLPGSVYMKHNWTYSKVNGTLMESIRSWENSTLKLAYKMTHGEYSSFYSTTGFFTSTIIEQSSIDFRTIGLAASVCVIILLYLHKRKNA